MRKIEFSVASMSFHFLEAVQAACFTTLIDIQITSRKHWNRLEQINLRELRREESANDNIDQ